MPLQPPRGFGSAATLDKGAAKRFVTEAFDYVKVACHHHQVTLMRFAVHALSMPTPQS